MRLIDADKLEANMYHEAFETDTDMQKWDSGCWIRYKMFEKQLEAQPIVEAIPIEWLEKEADKLIDTEYWYKDGYFLKAIIEKWEKENG